MYEGALALHYLDLGRDTTLAIESLDEANYELSNPGRSVCEALLEMLEGNSLNLDSGDVLEALNNIQGLLSSHLENKAAEHKVNSKTDLFSNTA